MLQVIRIGIYSGIREVVAEFNADAMIFARLWIQEYGVSGPYADSRYVIVRS